MRSGMRYAIVIEKTANSYLAYSPDVPGCGVTGATPEAVEQLLREAIAFHIEGLREDRLPIPEPLSRVGYLDLSPAAE